MEIPPEAFSEILEELHRRPIEINKYRNTAGDGRSQTWGVVNKRCLAPDFSRQCWMRPKLYHHLLEFGRKYVDISFNSITVNQNYKADRHRDKNNLGVSYLVGFGTYTGGRLLIHEGDLSGEHDINCKPIKADFSKIYHSVEDFEGERFSLVYYNFHNKRFTPLPEPSVKIENGQYYFYRGDKKITKKGGGLPHPLRHPPPKHTEVGEFIVSFD